MRQYFAKGTVKLNLKATDTSNDKVIIQDSVFFKRNRLWRQGRSKMGIVLIAHLRPLQIRIWKIPTSHWIEPLDKGVSYEDKNHCLIKEYPIPMLSSLYKICLVRFLHVCVQMTAMHLSLCPFQVGFLSGGYSVLTVILYIECRRGQHYSKVIRSE